MSLIAQKNDPTRLRNELVAARQQYNEAKNSVLDRAQTRHAVVSDTIADLKIEQDELLKIAEEARR